MGNLAQISRPSGTGRRTDAPRGRGRLALVGVFALLVAVGIVGLAVGSRPAFRQPPNVAASAGQLFLTTYNPPTVQRVDFSYAGGRLTMNGRTVLARLPGADGIAWSADGRLLVGGQATGLVEAVDPQSGAVARVSAGVANAFMVTLTPDGRQVYTSGLPGPLAQVPAAPLGAGHHMSLSGADTQVSDEAFAPNGPTLYTRSPPGGEGSIGILDPARGTTTQLFADAPAAHGIVYDPYTDSFLTMGGHTVYQLPARSPGTIESILSVPGVTQLDQGAVDGRGHAFLASNDGKIVFLDYAASKRVGDLSDKVVTRPLVANLDDFAPLIGPGARPIATGSARWKSAGEGALVLAALLALIVAARLALRARPRGGGDDRPRWDMRRQSSGS